MREISAIDIENLPDRAEIGANVLRGRIERVREFGAIGVGGGGGGGRRAGLLFRADGGAGARGDGWSGSAGSRRPASVVSGRQ